MTRKSRRELERLLDDLEESAMDADSLDDLSDRERDMLTQLCADAREVLDDDERNRLTALDDEIDTTANAGEDLTPAEKEYLDLLIGTASERQLADRNLTKGAESV